MEVLHSSAGSYEPRRVFYKGSDAILRGQGLCYDYAYVTSDPAGQAAGDAEDITVTCSMQRLQEEHGVEDEIAGRGKGPVVRDPGRSMTVMPLQLCQITW